MFSIVASEDKNGLRGCRQNRFVPLSEGVTSCAAHPLNGTIIAGTKVCVHDFLNATLN